MNLMWMKIFYQGARCLIDVCMFVVGITLLWCSTVMADAFRSFRLKVKPIAAFAPNVIGERWLRLNWLLTWPARRLMNRGVSSRNNEALSCGESGNGMANAGSPSRRDNSPRVNSRSERDQIFFPDPGRGSPAGIPAGAIPTPGAPSRERGHLLSCITWLSVLLFIGVALGVYLVSC